MSAFMLLSLIRVSPRFAAVLRRHVCRYLPPPCRYFATLLMMLIFAIDYA